MDWERIRCLESAASCDRRRDDGILMAAAAAAPVLSGLRHQRRPAVLARGLAGRPLERFLLTEGHAGQARVGIPDGLAADWTADAQDEYGEVAMRMDIGSPA